MISGSPFVQLERAGKGCPQILSILSIRRSRFGARRSLFIFKSLPHLPPVFSKKRGVRHPSLRRNAFDRLGGRRPLGGNRERRCVSRSRLRAGPPLFLDESWIGCRTLGVDWVPSFIGKASFLSRLFRLDSLQFRVRSLGEANLEEATVVYLYTFHPEEDRLDFSRLRPGARVITVSEPLLEGFSLKTRGLAAYPWGETEVYINIKK